MAQPDQVGERGLAALGEGLDVVDLQAFTQATPGDRAHRIAFLECSPDRGGDAAAGVRHRGHVHPVGDQDAQDRVDGQATGDLHRDRPHTGNLADLAGFDPAPYEGLVVDTDMDHGAGPRVAASRRSKPWPGTDPSLCSDPCARRSGVGDIGPARAASSTRAGLRPVDTPVVRGPG